MKLIEICAFIPRGYLEGKVNKNTCTHSILYNIENEECFECAICGKTFDSCVDIITPTALENRYIINIIPNDYIRWMMQYIIIRISHQYIDKKVINLPNIMNEIEPEIQEYLKKYNATKFYDKRIKNKLRKVIR